MKRRALSVTVIVCFVVSLAAVHLAGQSVPLRQIAYLKASNPGMSDHFAEGGALPGHTGMGVAVSGDGNTIAVGAPHESSSARGINGNENDDSAYNAGAVYVFARSGGQWARQAYVKASNTGAGDYFGSYVALSADGNTMAVAAHWESSAATGVNGNQADDSLPQAGAVYIFTRTGTTWTQQAYLKASNPGRRGKTEEDPGDGDQFGFSLALSRDGNTLAVGANSEDSNAAGTKSDQNDDSAYNAGAVYVFARSGDRWTRQAYVKASNTGAGDYFGSYVALSADGNTMAVAAHWESSAATGVNGNQADDSLPQAGAVYIFTRSGSTWTQRAYLKASNPGRVGSGGEDPGDGDQFGFSLALSRDGNTLAVGANSEDSNAAGVKSDQRDDSFSSAGAVYMFARTGGTWAQQAYLKADASTNTGLGDQFGFSVALNANGNTLAVGVYDESGSGRAVNAPIDRMRGGSGAVYVFGRSGTTWTREAYLKTWNAEGGDSWGVSVALSDDGNTLATGSLDEDCVCTGVVNAPSDVGLTDQKADLSTGAVAIFVRSGGAWSQQAYIKASNTGQEDWFGVRLALSGDGNTLAAGAPNEDSNAQGINGPQTNEAATEAGAVYVFTRSGGTWSQLAYVKGANTEAFDEFGGAVGLSRDGRTLVAGAKGEDSGSIGNPADSSIDEAGAAYIFTR